MREINVTELPVNAVGLWCNRWLLLTVGTMDDCNMMTVGWGSIGCMWSRPFVQVVVRPQRHTFGYMERFDSFTLCAFPEKHRADLRLLGSLSGRDGDKLSGTALTLRPSTRVAAPACNEADLVLECRKIYCQDMDPAGFLAPSIGENYAAGDYHRIYFGEIIAAFAAR